MATCRYVLNNNKAPSLKSLSWGPSVVWHLNYRELLFWFIKRNR